MKKIIFLFLLFTLSFSIDISPQMVDAAKRQYGISDEQIQDLTKQYVELNKTDKGSVEPVELSVKKEEIEETIEDTLDIQDDKKEGNEFLNKDDFKTFVSMRFPSHLKFFGYDIFNQVAMSFTPLSNIPVAGDYVLGPGDELKIYLWGNIQQNFSLIVDSGGDIILPNAGKVNVANLTLDQAKNLIRLELEKYFANFTMDITMGRLKTMEVFILGEVNTPGRYNVNSLSSVIYALYYSGGPTKVGSLREIKLIRNNKTIKVFDLYKLLLHGDKSDDVLLRPGDTIFVPKVAEQVAIVGEVKTPAIFELKGNTTLSSALEMSGKYTRNSYVKEINIIRKDIKNDEYVLRTVSFPTWGDFEYLSPKIAINDGDIIEIKSISDGVKNWVKVQGNVKFPGLYAFDKVKNVEELIERAGGTFSDTYLSRMNIYRVTSKNQYLIIPVNLETDNLKNITLNVFDKLVVYKNEEILKHEIVSVVGEVYKPGEFMFYDNMTLADAFFFSGTLKVFADTNRIEILRHDVSNNIKHLLSYNLNETEPESILLKPLDKIKIYSVDEKYKKETVKISGEVYFPSEIGFYQNINLEDIIYYVRGLKPNADTSYVTILRKQTSLDAKILTYNLEESNLSEIVLQPFDEVFVRSNPSFNTYGTVRVEGEVVFPGEYPLYKGESLADLIMRVGGFSDRAHLPGIELYRDFKEKDSFLKLQIPESQENVIRTIAELADFRRIKINAKGLFVDNNKQEDILLMDGDKIVVPVIPDEIKVVGGVYNGGSFVFVPNKNADFYLNKAGSFRKDALAEELFVVHSDGTVTKVNSWSYTVVRGDSIVVPTKVIKEFDIVKALLDFTQIVFNIATTWVVIFK